LVGRPVGDGEGEELCVTKSTLLEAEEKKNYKTILRPKMHVRKGKRGEPFPIEEGFPGLHHRGRESLFRRKEGGH